MKIVLKSSLMFASTGRMMTDLHKLCAAILWVSTVVIWQPDLCHGINTYSESDAAKYLDFINHENAEWARRTTQGVWNYITNATEENALKSYALDDKFEDFEIATHQEMKKYSWSTYRDPNILRQHKLLVEKSSGGLPKEKIRQFRESVYSMENVFHFAPVPKYGNKPNKHSNQSLSIEPDINDKTATNFDLNERTRMWKEWANSTGKVVRKLFPEYIKRSNEHAKLKNFEHVSDYWLKSYETYDIQGRVERLWYHVRPLYLHIHAYVRRKLWDRYGDSVLKRRGPIPVHLIHDLWSQSWDRLANFTLPYPDEVDDIDPTAAMINQKYTVQKMFKLADNSFKSMNLSAMPRSFWEKSIFEKPKRGKMICEAMAYDFQDSEDFRITQCATVNFEEFLTAHKLMGRIQYYLQYKDQPFIYREGANDGFADAVSEAFVLSASTPRHLHRIGLSAKRERTPEAVINHLYRLALNKITFLSFGYITDLWRWNAFDKVSTNDSYNSDWWELRYIYQGLVPPIPRSENDFDPGTKSFIVENIPFIEHFMSYIMQFQLHQALCKKAGQYNPNNPQTKHLHLCDAFQSTKAGNAFKEIMKLGRSVPWFDVMKKLTGQREIDAEHLMNYFLPLHQWLIKENEKTDELIGWEQDISMCMTIGGEKCRLQEPESHELSYYSEHRNKYKKFVQKQSESLAQNLSDSELDYLYEKHFKDLSEQNNSDTSINHTDPIDSELFDI